MSSINSRTVQFLLERYGYFFYIVKRVPETKCTCVNPITTSPDPKCKKCLGTGSKIVIERVFGSIRETRERENSTTGKISSTPKVVYLKGFYRINKDDIVIDDEDVYHVLASQHHKGEHGEFAFTRLICPYTKETPVHIIRNFKELLNEYKLRKKK